MTDQVITAVFAEFQMVKTRGMLKLIFEVPLEQGESALAILGVPLPAQERWVAIAPLVHGAVERKASTIVGGETALRQCHALSKEYKFQKWIISRFGNTYMENLSLAEAEAMTRAIIIEFCNISSRGELLTKRDAINKWAEIVATFRKENNVY